jgi:hypothetical protein
MPIGFVFFAWLLVTSITAKRVPAALYFPEYPKSTKPTGYYLSLVYIFALMIVCALGTLDQTFGIAII